jgi:hypothetical protein
MTKDIIDDLSKIIPVGSIFIILCSSIKLILFYKQFNISISDYLNLGEYATLFVDDIIYYLAIFSLGLILNEFDSHPTKKLNTETDNFDYSVFRKERFWIIIILVIIIFTIITLLFIINSLYQKLDIVKVGFFLLLCLLYIFLQKVRTNIKLSYRSLIILVILFYTAMDGFIDAQKIIENKNGLNYKITLDNKIISTNNDLHYLGKSEKYFFLYSLKKKEATILSNSKLDKIQIIEIKKKSCSTQVSKMNNKKQAVNN